MEDTTKEEETRLRHKRLYELMAEIVRAQVKVIDCMAGTLYNDGYRRGRMASSNSLEDFVAKNHTAQDSSDR